MGDGARVALRAVAVVAEVEANLARRSLSATLGAGAGRQGAVLGRRARRPGRGCLGSGLELPDLLLRLRKGRRRVRRLSRRRGVRRVRHRSVSRLSLLVLQHHLVALFPRLWGTETYVLSVPWPDTLILADFLLQVRRHLAKVAQVELPGRLAEADRLEVRHRGPRRAAQTDARSDAP